MSKHTSAPWVIADDGTIEAKHAGLVGYVSEVNDADRNLIAAAPALLAALQAYEAAMVRRVVRKDGSTTLEMDFKTLEQAKATANAARAAIAKAERREP